MALLVLLAAGLAPRVGLAQEQGDAVDPWADVEQMVVTGSGAAGVLADIADANSVTAFDADELSALGASDISDIASFTPNLEIVTAGATSPTFFIRGIGLNDFNANAAGAVAIYSDDIPLNSPALQLGALFDIETVNVLRGPQGGGSYRNASAGSIKTYSKMPSGDFSGFFSTEYGNFDHVDLQGAVEMPVLGDWLSTRVSFRFQDRDGWMRNRCAGAPPIADRQTRLPGGSPFDPRWSFCGEAVAQQSVSEVDPGQPKFLNSRQNWGARIAIVARPETFLGLFDLPETEYRLVFRGRDLDQPSTVGQAIGSNANQTFPGTGEPDINGRLGGPDNGRYRDQDIIDRNILLNRAFENEICPTGCSRDERLLARSQAAFQLSQELARSLDQDPFTGAYSHTGGTTNTTWGFASKLSLDWSEAITATIITGYDEWDRTVDIDLDFSPNTLFETQTKDDGYQVFQEIRLDGEFGLGGDGPFGGLVTWQLGGFGLYEDLDVRVDNNFGAGTSFSTAPRSREYTQNVTTFAAYGELALELTETLTLDGGIRYNYERREIFYELFQQVSFPIVTNDEITGTEPTGTIRLTWDPTADLSFYAKWTKGWKSGTFNATGSARLGVSPADAEEISAYEIGTSGELFDGMVSFYGSFFHYTYDNYQLFTSQSAFGALPEFVILNAKEVELFGSELEAKFTPWPGGLFDLKFAWLEGEFIDFVQLRLSPEGEDVLDPAIILVELNNSGNRLLNAPQYQVIMTIQQAIPLGRFGDLVPRWDATWKDDTFFDATEGVGIPNSDQVTFLPENTIGQRAYWVHNFRLSWISPTGDIDISFWMRNVLNENYKLFSADLTSFQQTTLHFVGEPRTYGLGASFRW